MSNFYKTVKLVNSMTKDDMAAVALELAATNPELFVQLASKFGLQIQKQQSLAEKVDAEAKSYGGVGSLFVRRIKAYREITGAALKEAKEWVEENFKDCGRGEPR